MESDSREFEVHRRLGAGGMGEVFLATARGASRSQWVALKRLRAEVSDRPEYLVQFEREARICSLLAHENIVALESFGRDAQGPFLALQYVEGTSAAKLVTGLREADESVPLAAAYSIARDAARGLQYAHGLDTGDGERGVIHRDLSPDNLLIARTGIAKLADFGIAKLAGGTTLTKTGVVKGKFAYMAPELFEGHEATVASDVFSFAASLYFILCAVSPFQGRSDAELMRAVLSARPPPPSAVRAEVPADLDRWIARALSKASGERPALGELLDILNALLPEGGGREEVARCVLRVAPQAVAPPEPLPPQTKEARRDGGRKTRTVWIAVAAACVTGAVGAWVGRSWRPEPVLAPATHVEGIDPSPPPSPAPPPAVVASAPEAVAPSPVRPGTVLIKVRPWARVFFDGKERGVTPMPPFEAKPGTHALILVNDELKVRRTYSVRVRSGHQAELHYSLDTAEPDPTH